MWIVQLTPPNVMSNYAWSYPAGWFPRQYRYKTEAKQCAKTAKAMGATNITVKEIK